MDDQLYISLLARNRGHVVGARKSLVDQIFLSGGKGNSVCLLESSGTFLRLAANWLSHPSGGKGIGEATIRQDL